MIPGSHSHTAYKDTYEQTRLICQAWDISVTARCKQWVTAKNLMLGAFVTVTSLDEHYW
jgi:hypothetical protein